MKTLLVSVGTQGDMEPFLAIGELLQSRGHEVLCCFPEQFRNLAQSSNLGFASLGEKFIELLNSEDGKAAMGGASGWKKVLGTLRLAFKQKEANQELLFKQRDVVESFAPDVILYNGKAVYPLIWHLQTNGKIIYISPLPFMHYVESYSHIAFNGNYGKIINKWSYSLANFGMFATLRMSKKWLDIKDRFSRAELKKVVTQSKTIYTISPSLLPKIRHWPDNVSLLGYHQKKDTSKWIPPNGLVQFLEKNNKILFISFGSMINPAPEKKTNLILEILERHNIPAIINIASGGLVQPASYNLERFYFTKRIPYSWIFPKVFGVIHHGGSGTTHLAAKYACASLVIPHIIDQFMWNKVSANLELGPLGIKINKLTRTALEPRILDLMNNPDYKKNAQILSISMAKEEWTEPLYQSIIKA
jgi:UDP:flavonoid glycosyltransferase YjiC (YdhE family)